MKKVLVLLWFCAMIVAAQAQVDKGVSTTGQLGTTSDTRSFVDEKGHIVTRPRLTRTGKVIRTTIASVITSPTSTVTTITAISGGNVLSDGGAEVTARGVCWSTSPNPTLESNLGYTADGVGVGEFVSTLTGLLECTTYYVRAYATNSVGTTYGEQETFNTLPDMDYAINFGYSVDFGKVTIVSTSATSAVWKNSSNQTVGEWVSGTTSVLPVGTYTVELTSEDCGTNSITIDILSSPICAVEIVNSNETGFTPTPAYSGKYISALKDVDNNTYNVLQIGEQCWIKENLRTTKFANGTTIVRGETSSDRSATTPYCYYTNFDEANVSSYGYLYNWPAVMNGASSSAANPSGVQGVCPNGWHVPSSAELTTLTDYVSNQNVFLCNGVDDNIAAALTTTTGWQDATAECVAGSASETSNYTGFSVLPAGDAQGVDVNFGRCTYFWSTTEDNSNTSYAEHLALCRDYPMTGFLSIDKYQGYSVRCVRNEGCELSMELTANLANSTDFGKVTINSTNATSATWKDADGNTVGTWLSGTTDVLPAGTYTVTLSADECSTSTVTVEVLASPICKVANINSNETGENGVITQLSDIETNSYNVLSIAGQCWIRENLRTTKYADGTSIAISDDEYNPSMAYRYYPNNDENNVETYGYLYNALAATHSTLTDTASQGVCPDGWHVPSDAEWRTLTAFVSAHEELYCEESENNSKALSSTTGWNYADKSDCAPGKDASTNNLTGLGLLPAGEFTGSFKEFSSYAEYWSSSYLVDAEHPNNNEYTRSIAIAGGNTLVKHRFEANGQAISVRCVRGEGCPTSMTYTINLGNSEDFGRVTVNSTNAISASWKDAEGNEIGTWNTVGDKTPVLPVGEYTIELTGAECNKTLIFNISATPFCAVSSVKANETEYVPSITTTGKFINKLQDYDGNVYNVVQLGPSCWIKENYKAVHYADGTAMKYGNGKLSADTAYYEFPAEDTNNVAQYGLLYNWPATMNGSNNEHFQAVIQGVCPDGWHVLGYTDIFDFGTVFDLPAFQCDATDGFVAKSLAATTSWNTSTEICAIGNDLTSNNATGLSILPAGFHTDHYDDLGNSAEFWLSLGMEDSKALFMDFRYDHSWPELDGDNPMNRNAAFSVRCLRGEATKLPTVTTAEISNATGATATAGGNVNTEGATVEITSYGVCWAKDKLPVIDKHEDPYCETAGSIEGSYTCEMTGLEEGETYNVRAFVKTTQEFVVYGNVVSFTPCGINFDYTLNLGNTPDFGKVTINSTNATTAVWKNSNGDTIGNWNTEGEMTEVLPVDIYSVDLTRDCGKKTVSVYVPTSPICTSSTALNANETKHTASFKGNYLSAMKDVDDNTYNVVQIGGQCWMKENLRATKYADETPIALGTDTSKTVPYRYNPNNDANNVSDYGYLYNWSAIMKGMGSSDSNPSGVQGICPDGWHVPGWQESRQVQSMLTMFPQIYSCGTSDSTGKATAATYGWQSSGTKCAIGNDLTTNNASGFSALPAGSVAVDDINGMIYKGFGETMDWATTYCPNDEYTSMWLNYNNVRIGLSATSKYIAHSVRCVRGQGNGVPTVTTADTSNVTATSATTGGNVTFDGNSEVTARGVCWSTTANPSTADNHTSNGTGIGVFTSEMTGLTKGTTYYVRAYATNEFGTTYGNQITFTTPIEPTVTTTVINEATDIAGSSATGGGNVTSDGGATVTVRGVCWSADPDQELTTALTTKTEDGTGTGEFTSTITGLEACTHYYVRAYATNIVGTSYGEVVEFTTPVSMDYEINMGNSADFGKVTIKSTSATSASWKDAKGEEIGQWNDGKTDILPVGHYDVLLIAEGCGTATFSFDILSSPICTAEAAGDNEGTYTAPTANYDGTYINKLTDRESNEYNVVQIGSQCWLKDNLKTKTFANGQAIRAYDYANDLTFITFNYQPTAANYVTPYEGDFGEYDNTTETYGLLYDWNAATQYANGSDANPSGIQGLCPDGWHIPSINEYEQLTTFVSNREEYVCGSNPQNIGKALSLGEAWNLSGAMLFGLAGQEMSSDTACWILTDMSSRNNATGFSLSPAGNGSMAAFPIGSVACVLSSTIDPDSDPVNTNNEEMVARYEHYYKEAYVLFSLYGATSLTGASSYKYGLYSVRCVRGAGNNTPSVTTGTPSNVLSTTASCSGEVTADGGAPLTAKGLCWTRIHRHPVIEDDFSDIDAGMGGVTNEGSDLGSFTSTLTNLTPGATYYVRAYATNSMGTSYGNEVSFIAAAAPPTVTTADVSEFLGSKAVAGGNVTLEGGVPVTERGICWGTEADPTIEGNHIVIGSGGGAFADTIKGLTACETYHVRAYAINSLGLSYGEDKEFEMPVSMDYIVNMGNSEDFGKVTIYSSAASSAVWKNANDAIVGTWLTGTTDVLPVGTYSVVLTADCGTYTTTIDILASPICSVSSINSNETGETPSYGSYISKLTDVDANNYNVVQIGSQCWMKENLRTTRYSDETSIALGSSTATNTAYRYYPNDNESDVERLGYLYNWRATTNQAVGSSTNPSGIQGVCPTGWHVPSEGEQKQLQDYLRSYSVFYEYSSSDHSNNNIAKSLAANSDWKNNTVIGNNISENNVSGFTALPIVNSTSFWNTYTSTGTSRNAGYMIISNSYSTLNIYNNINKGSKYSVRCVRDVPYGIPTVITSQVYNLETDTPGGEVTADGGAEVTARGVCWSKSEYPTIADNHTSDGTGLGSFTSELTDLIPCEHYYIRAYATNSVGTAYGERYGFSAPATVVPTMEYTINMGNSENFGQISITNTDNVASASWSLDGTYSTSGTWTSGNTSILPVGIYHVDLSQNCAHNTISNIEILSSPVCAVTSVNSNETQYNGIPSTGKQYIDKVTDVDENEYSVVQIGNQCWMKENLRTKKYANGTDIAHGEGLVWSDETAYYEYPANESSNATTYGLLYNWTAVMHGAAGSESNPSGVQGVCPAGWHVPSEAEFNTLISYVGSKDTFNCGGSSTYIAKALAAHSLWNSSDANDCVVGNNLSKNNLTGFTMLPAGGREDNEYVPVGAHSVLWTSVGSEDNGDKYGNALIVSSNNRSCSIAPTLSKSCWSVRCVRDVLYGTPTVTTNAVSSITTSTAICGGEVTSGGGEQQITRGVCWHTEPNPTLNWGNHTEDGVGIGSFTSELTGLNPCTIYYVRAYATNSMGTSYGENVTFTTTSDGTIPTMDLTPIENESYNIGRVRIDNATSSIVSVSWRNSQGVEIGTWKDYSTPVLPVDTYTVIVTNGCGVSNTLSVAVPISPICKVSSINSGEYEEYGDFNDETNKYINQFNYNNKYYSVIQIGSQCWMKENLRTTSFADGTPIANGTNEEASSTIPYYYYPANESYSVNSYGALYNWPAIMKGRNSSAANPSGVQGICPVGWHVPSDVEWTQLTTTVGSRSAYQCDDNVNNIAKALASNSYWNNSENPCAVGYNSYSNNQTSFGIIPAGYYNGDASTIGEDANLWSATESDNSHAYARILPSEYSQVLREPISKNNGLSVRCVRGASYTTPLINTAAVSDITISSATCGGSISDDGGSTVTARGVCWSTSSEPTITDNHTTDNSGTGAFTSNITELTPCTIYHVRAYATNQTGTAYGDEITFATLPDVDYTFNHGNTADFGTVDISSTSAVSAVWKNSDETPIGDWLNERTEILPVGTYSVELTTDNCGVRTVSINVPASPICTVTTVNTNETTYTTSFGGNYIKNLTDVDNNVYNVVQIGTQCWTKENLRVTHWKDGTSIPFATTSSSFSNLYRYNPNNDTTLVGEYGFLYNFYTTTSTTNDEYFSEQLTHSTLCPEGWIVPDHATGWLKLITYIQSQSEYTCGGNSDYIASAVSANSSIVSSTGTCSPGYDLSFNNLTGLSLPFAGGFIAGSYQYFGERAIYWDGNYLNETSWTRELTYNKSIIDWSGYQRNAAFPARCVRK